MRATVVTSATKIGHRQSLFEDPTDASCAVLGTEGRAVLAMQPDCTRVAFAVGVPSVPVSISATGTLIGDHRIGFSGRDGKVRFIRNRTLCPDSIEPDHAATEVLLTGTHTVVATAGKDVFFYATRGRRFLFKHRMTSHVVALRCLTGSRSEGSYGTLVVVVLRDGSAQVLDGPQIVSLSPARGRGGIVGAFVGAFGREDTAICSLGDQEGFVVRTLRRRAGLGGGAGGGGGIGEAGGAPGPRGTGSGSLRGLGPGYGSAVMRRLTPAEQDTPLPLPKRTRAFLEIAERELDDTAAVHVGF